MRPSNCCRWCTTSCASWRRSGWRSEQPGQTLQATALVHEAYLRLVDVERRPAVERPRPLLRRRRRGDAADPGRAAPGAASGVKHGGGLRTRRGAGRVAARRRADGAPTTCWRWTRRWTGWRAEDPQSAELVKLRYFAGLTIAQAAERPGHLAAHGRPALGVRPGVAATRAGRRVADGRARCAARRSDSVARRRRRNVALSARRLAPSSHDEATHAANATSSSRRCRRRRPPERAAYLDEACGGDADLRSRVERLLLEHERQAELHPRLAGRPACGPRRPRPADPSRRRPAR